MDSSSNCFDGNQSCKPTGNIEQSAAALHKVLASHDSLAVAVSGGVDSMTLSAFAFDVLRERVLMVHAVSPAVPPEATRRVKDHAMSAGWQLEIIDAGEFADDDYRSNPVNRCYFCKSNLYARVRQVWAGCIASGANLDDLGDYRPGLLAAREKLVVHPLIEAGIDKLTVRAMAKSLGLHDIATLPAQPCLSSRIETGISINADDLIFVHKVETFLRRHLGDGNIRCRITAQGVRVEVEPALQKKNAAQWPSVCLEVTQLITQSNRILAGFGHYVRGSAFLQQGLPVVKMS